MYHTSVTESGRDTARTMHVYLTLGESRNFGPGAIGVAPRKKFNFVILLILETNKFFLQAD